MLRTGGTSGRGIKRRSTKAGAAAIAIRPTGARRRKGPSIANLRSEPYSIPPRAIGTLHCRGARLRATSRDADTVEGGARPVLRIGAPPDIGIRIDRVVVLQG